MIRWRKRLQSLPGWNASASARWAWAFLLIIALLALLGPLISNEKPYYCTLNGQHYFPLFSSVSEASLSVAHPGHSPVDWKTTSFDFIIRPPIPYSHFSIDLKAGILVSPFDTQEGQWRNRHWLGTDQLGRDVLAGMIRGCRVSLLIGLGSMLLALIAGVPLGAAAAYFGNSGWKSSWPRIFLAGGISTVIALIWFTPLPIGLQWMLTILLTGILCWVLLYPYQKERLPVAIPLDRMVMNVVSVVDGFPAIFLILILIAIIPVKGWIVVMCTIAVLRWPVMARYMRAEVFKIRETNYITAARILTFPSWYILWKHIIPFAIRPVMISFVFGVSSAILAESTLSFLGIGLPAEEINWGRLLAQSRNHFEAWWLVLFPGMAIFLTLLSLYTIGNTWQSARLNPAS